MEWLFWLVIAWFVGRRILKAYSDAQESVSSNQSGEDWAEPGRPAQTDSGLQKSETPWQDIKRMGHERGPKTPRDGTIEAKETTTGDARYKPAGRYKKKPSPLSKKPRKVQVKVRAGWFN